MAGMAMMMFLVHLLGRVQQERRRGEKDPEAPPAQIWGDLRAEHQHFPTFAPSFSHKEIRSPAVLDATLTTHTHTLLCVANKKKNLNLTSCELTSGGDSPVQDAVI